MFGIAWDLLASSGIFWDCLRPLGSFGCLDPLGSFGVILDFLSRLGSF